MILLIIAALLNSRVEINHDEGFANFMTSEIIRKNNISIEGKHDAKQVIIFAHGFGTDKTAWNNVKSAFSDSYKLVLYDNVGGGNSESTAFSPIKYSTISAYADDLIAIAEQLSLNNAIVVAHSVSSMISLLAAIRAPQYFSKMVFIGASPRYLDDINYVGGFNQAELDSMYEMMRTNYHAWVSGFSLAAMGNADKPELGAEFARTLSAIRPDIALSVAKVIFNSDVRDDLKKVQKDILLIQSQKDIAVPFEVSEYLNQNIQGSKLVVVDAEGHFPHISAPEIVVSSIKGFIE